MKTALLINQLLKIEDDYTKLEQENALLKIALDQKGNNKMSVILQSLIEIGKEKLFDTVFTSYRSDLSYDEDGINNDFEAWFERTFNTSKVPENLSVIETKKIVMEKFEEVYVKMSKDAQLEYARSKIGTK